MYLIPNKTREHGCFLADDHGPARAEVQIVDAQVGRATDRTVVQLIVVNDDIPVADGVEENA